MLLAALHGTGTPPTFLRAWRSLILGRAKTRENRHMSGRQRWETLIKISVVGLSNTLV